MQLKYVKPALFEQLLVVSAELVEYENRIKINYRVTDKESGEVLTKGYTVQVAVDGRTKELLFESPAPLRARVAELGQDVSG